MRYKYVLLTYLPACLHRRLLTGYTIAQPGKLTIQVNMCCLINCLINYDNDIDKQLSYRRETALQGGLVMAKSGRL